MAAIIYTAKRNLVAGHTIDTQYSFDVGLATFTPKTKANRKTHTSLSGHVEHWLSSVVDSAVCETPPLLESDPLCGIMWEFLTSCIGGETFSLDVWGTVSTPDSPHDFILTSTSIDPVRHGDTRCLSFPFEIREVI